MAAIWATNDYVAGKGGLVCPTNCSCDQLTACGNPYITIPPPQPGVPLYLQPCVLPASAAQQVRL